MTIRSTRSSGHTLSTTSLPLGSTQPLTGTPAPPLHRFRQARTCGSPSRHPLARRELVALCTGWGTSRPRHGSTTGPPRRPPACHLVNDESWVKREDSPSATVAEVHPTGPSQPEAPIFGRGIFHPAEKLNESNESGGSRSASPRVRPHPPPPATLPMHNEPQTARPVSTQVDLEPVPEQPPRETDRHHHLFQDYHRQPRL